jgi:hypothetical protein
LVNELPSHSILLCRSVEGYEFRAKVLWVHNR